MGQACAFSVINLYQCDPGFRTGRRVFPYHYLLYVHNGTGQYKIGSRLYPAAMGDLFYCPPGVANDIIADAADPFLLSGLEFTCDGDPALAERLQPAVNLLPEPFLIELIREMIQEYSYGLSDSGAVCSSLLNALILRLLRLPRAGGPDSREVVPALLDYIKANLSREVTHAELSRVFSYHKNSINRLLTGATGMSLKNYQISLRIKKAAGLLAYSDKTVGEIAELCGYQSAAFFSRQFREKTGITPLQFRKEGRFYLLGKRQNLD